MCDVHDCHECHIEERHPTLKDRIPHWLAAVYRPEPTPRWVGPALTAILIATSLGRAADYLAHPTPQGELLAYIEIFGVRTWGWAFLVVGVGLAVALLSRGLAPLVVAHCVGVGVYAAYWIALLQGVLDAAGAAGVRVVVVFGGFVVVAALGWAWWAQIRDRHRFGSVVGAVVFAFGVILWAFALSELPASANQGAGGWRFVVIAGAGGAVHVIRVVTLANDVSVAARRPPTDRRAVPRP